jgi:hypothetical protein
VGCVISGLHRELLPDRRGRVTNLLHDAYAPNISLRSHWQHESCCDRRSLFWSRYSWELSNIKTTWSIEAEQAINSKKKIPQLRLGQSADGRARFFVSSAAQYLTCRAVGRSARQEAIDACLVLLNEPVAIN